ncbi:MAG: molybdopterin-synthase adenylyltransferase MoeB [Verrucomicrobia bacterium]|nr:molybdopterin-synthase adenylyltransferase MoeB [Verrucomicrobiota bacterium]
MTADFSREELTRYARQLSLPEVGVEGQAKLKRSAVAVVGLGGLGSPAAIYLAAAGVGRLGLIDFDEVDLSNIQRQIIHHSSDCGVKKVDSASAAIVRINPNVTVEPHDVRLDAANATTILESYDVVVDATDNFATRYLVNDACVLLRKPDVYGSIFRFEGQVSVFGFDNGPCYRCLYPEAPPPETTPDCAEAGVIGVLPGVIGLIQATETIKLILNLGVPLSGRLISFDALAMTFKEYELTRDPDCPACGDEPVITSLEDSFAAREQFPCPADEEIEQISAAALARKLEAEAPIIILDVREPFEHEIASLPASVHIRLSELPDRFDGLERGRDIVVLCHSGIRSMAAVRFLRNAGFPHVANLEGGIDAWSVEVDPSLPRY